MTWLSFEDLLQTAGSQTGNFLRDAANTIADGYCSLYSSHPGFVVGSNSDPITPFRRGLANSLCHGRSPSPNPPQPPPFHGGQCSKEYHIDFNATGTPKGGGSPVTGSNQRAYVYGPVGGISSKKGSDGNFYVTIDAYDDSPPHDAKHYELLYFTSEGFESIDSVTILGVVPVDGVDNCGDLPPDWGGNNPPDDLTHRDLPLPIPDGGPTLIVPIVYVPINGEVEVNFQLNLSIPVTINFNLGEMF